ncbi:MAG: hypothetical protein V2J55_20560, partial [Candidatus Competibacteraceae bacterium]|nr:hypothetical protein [Candidatus Competibacteraceae bacterium]
MNNTNKNFALRPFTPVLLTGLFLPADLSDIPQHVPLPNAPVPNTTLQLPTGGLMLFYGQGAPGLMGQALQRGQAQDWRCIGARIGATFNQVQASRQRLTLDNLPQVELLWLDRIQTMPEVAARVQDHLLRYRQEAGNPDTADTPSRYTLATQHPELLVRLLTEPEFSHLRALVVTLPRLKAQDGDRPAAQCMYVRDMSVLTSIQVDYGIA